MEGGGCSSCEHPHLPDLVGRHKALSSFPSGVADCRGHGWGGGAGFPALLAARERSLASFFLKKKKIIIIKGNFFSFSSIPAHSFCLSSGEATKHKLQCLHFALGRAGQGVWAPHSHRVGASPPEHPALHLHELQPPSPAPQRWVTCRGSGCPCAGGGPASCVARTNCRQWGCELPSLPGSAQPPPPPPPAEPGGDLGRREALSPGPANPGVPGIPPPSSSQTPPPFPAPLPPVLLPAPRG